MNRRRGKCTDRCGGCITPVAEPEINTARTRPHFARSHFGRTAVMATMGWAVVFSGTLGCKREERAFRVSAPSVSRGSGVRLTPFQAGPSGSGGSVKTEFELNAVALSEGQRLFSAFNCTGCHANGGGGMGPALM